MALRTSISILIFAATLISATSPAGIHRRQDAVVATDASQLKKYSQIDTFGEGMKTNRNDFARILFENYKKLTSSMEEPTEESSIQGIKTSELPRRKLDTGNNPTRATILTDGPPTLVHLFPVHNLNSTSLRNKTVETRGTGGQHGADRSKDPRFHYGEANSHPLISQTRAQAQESHTAELVFPDTINEVASPHFDHPVHHHGHHYIQHQQPPYYGHHSPKHVEIHEHLPHSVQHHQDYSGLAHAVSKSLKFWIPTALLLTGASVLFPQRVKVPTNLEDIQNNRPKRSTHYEFTAGSDEEGRRFEKILPAVLSREHRTAHVTINEGTDEFLQKAPSQYYEPHDFQRIRNTDAPAPTVGQSSNRKQRPQTAAKSTTSIPRRTVAFQTQNSEMQERPISPSRYDSGYDAFEYHKEESPMGDGAGRIENFYVPHPTVSSMTSTKSVAQEASGPKPKQGRKVRVLLRARKNGTLATPPSSGPQDGFVVEPKNKSENKIPPKVKIQPTKQTPTATSAVTKVTPAATTPMKPPTSPPSLPAARTHSPVVINATKSPKSLQTQHLFQRDPDLLQLLSESIRTPSLTKSSPSSSFEGNSNPEKLYDLSPGGPVVGLLSSVIEHKNESEACQKRALCELAIKGTNPNATRFETFMWTLATLVPDAFTTFYDLEDTFAAIREKQCTRYACANPNLDIQE